MEKQECTIIVQVKPNSKKFEIQEFDEKNKVLKINLKSIPEKGKANKELIKELTKKFKCKIELIKGIKNKKKTIKLNKSFKEITLILKK